MQKEGRRIKSRIPMDTVSLYIMPNRVGASNTFSSSIDIEKCEELIRQKRAEGLKGFGMLHIFLAAYIRTISKRPGINRFIRGQRTYARSGIEICITIKKELKLNAPETVVKLFASPYDTLDTVYSKLNQIIEENKNDGDQNGMDGVARALSHIPGVILKFSVWFLKLLDYFGLLPRSLTKISPFHGSMFITNMGSLGIPPIFHHLYDFGTLPVFVSMGMKRTGYMVSEDGTYVKKRLLDFTVVCDERICDGHYYASSFKVYKKYLENPYELLTPPEQVLDDIE